MADSTSPGTAASSLGTTGGTSTAGLAPWAADYITNYLGQAQALGKLPYQVYQGPLTAGPSALQNQAFQGISGLQMPGAVGQNTNLLGQLAQGLGSFKYNPVGTSFVNGQPLAQPSSTMGTWGDGKPVIMQQGTPPNPYEHDWDYMKYLPKPGSMPGGIQGQGGLPPLPSSGPFVPGPMPGGIIPMPRGGTDRNPIYTQPVQPGGSYVDPETGQPISQAPGLPKDSIYNQPGGFGYDPNRNRGPAQPNVPIKPISGTDLMYPGGSATFDESTGQYRTDPFAKGVPAPGTIGTPSTPPDYYGLPPGGFIDSDGQPRIPVVDQVSPVGLDYFDQYGNQPGKIGTSTPQQGGISGLNAPTPQQPVSSIAQQYMNPYLQSALAPQLEEMRRQSQANLQPALSKLSQAGGLGGGRQAIMESEAARNLLTQQARTTGEQYANAYDKAMAQFNAEQARKIQEAQFGTTTGLQAQQQQAQAAQAAGQLGLNQFGAQQNLMNQMLQAGGIQRDIGQQGITADYNEFLRQQQFPYQQLQFQRDMLSGLPIGSVTNTPAQLSGIASLIAAVGGVDKLLSATGQKDLGSLLNNLFGGTLGSSSDTNP